MVLRDKTKAIFIHNRKSDEYIAVETSHLDLSMKFSFQWSKIALTLLLGMIMANLAYINYQLFISRPKNETINEVNTSTNEQPLFHESFSTKTGDKEASASEKSSIDLAPVFETIRESTSELTQKVDLLSKTQAAAKISPTTRYPQNKRREYIIPLGTGSSSASDWTDLNGVETYFDPSNYGTVKEMYFEASLVVPTGAGRVYARLRNVTDNIGLVESEIYKEGVEGLVSSGKLPLQQLTKLYRIQLKSTLGAAALIENARIKIYVE